jgi:ribosomal protein S18 acetylase RimI-like enzyme
MFEEKTLSPSLNELNPGISRRDNELCGAVISVQTLTLIPVTSSDDPFLYRTYASTRSEEMALMGWSAEQTEAFLRMQFEAQRRSYRMQLPDATYWVIQCSDIAVGRLILDRTLEEIHIVDIALLPEFRGHGIGATLMKSLMTEAAQAAKVVRLHVERFNPALRWYEGLGFSVVNSGPIYLEMVWRSGSDAPRAVSGLAV